MPGTHWMHPHYHGSTMLQVSGGTALAIIIEDPAGYLPAQVEEATEQLMVIMHHDFDTTQDVADDAGDSVFSFTGNNDEFITVNGIQEPTFRLKSGEWQRWRIVYAGWAPGALDLNVQTPGNSDGICEWQLLA